MGCANCPECVSSRGASPGFKRKELHATEGAVERFAERCSLNSAHPSQRSRVTRHTLFFYERMWPKRENGDGGTRLPVTVRSRVHVFNFKATSNIQQTDVQGSSLKPAHRWRGGPRRRQQHAHAPHPQRGSVSRTRSSRPALSPPLRAAPFARTQPRLVSTAPAARGTACASFEPQPPSDSVRRGVHATSRLRPATATRG